MGTLLPPNATSAELALEGATARISDIPVPVADTWTPALCPAAWLPWLAWAFSVDTWNAAWPESVKRQVIAAAYDVHRVKGTVGALLRALDSLDLDNVAVLEWFQQDPIGDPYTFDVEVELTTRGLSVDEEDSILAVIAAAKNVRSHLGTLRVWLTNRSAVPVIGLTLASGEDATVYPFAITEIEAAGATPMIALAHYGVETTTLYPS